MENNQSDKTDSGSLSESGGKAASSQDVNSGASSALQSESKGAEKPSFEQAMADGFKKLSVEHGTSESETGEEKAEDGNVQNLNNTAEGEENTEAKEKEGEEAEGETEESADGEEEQEKGPVPYSRFEEKVREVEDKDERIKQLTPAAEGHKVIMDYLETNGHTQDEFVEAMQLMTLMKTDPVEFGKRMQTVLEGVGVLSGDKLPEDLAKKVADGVIDADSAKEIAQLRARTQLGQRRQELTAKQQQQKQQTEFARTIQTAWGDWATQMGSKYPDFKPKRNGGNDGIFEMVNDKMTSLGTQVNADGSPKYPIRSAADAVAIANEAFKSVYLAVKGVMPKPVNRKAPLGSNGSSSSTVNKDPMKAKTLEEAMQIRHGQLTSGRRR